MTPQAPDNNYEGIRGDIVSLLELARRTAARSVNALMTATYWEIGSLFYERTALSHNKVAMLTKAEAGDVLTPAQAIKDPFTTRNGITASRTN